MSLVVTNIKNIKCIYCGSIQRICSECGNTFHVSRDDHVLCRERCRVRKLRRLKKEAEESNDIVIID